MTEQFEDKSRRSGRGLGAVRRIQKLGRAIGRQGPPPGMVPFEGDGDGDGFENDDDPMKRRWVGFQRVGIFLQSRRLARQIGELKDILEKYEEETKLKIKSKRKIVKAKPIKSQGNRPVKTSNLDFLHIAAATGQRHSSYRYEPPELMIREVEGTYTDFVAENFKSFPWGENFKDWKKNHKVQLANMISLLLNIEGNADPSYLRIPPDVILSELDLEPKDRRFEPMLTARTGLSYESFFKKWSDRWGIKKNSHGQKVKDERENEMMRKLIENAMEQSEPFARLVEIFGLPSVTPLRPQPPRRDLLVAAGGDEVVASGLEEITNLHGNVLGSAFDGNIFIQLIDLLDGNDTVDLDPDRDDLDYKYGNSGLSPETTLRHEFAHYLDSQGDGLISMMGATPEQERIVKEAFAEIREMNEKALEETLNSPEVKNVLDSINKTVRELNIALQTGQTDLANAQRLIASINNTVVNVGRIAADDTFPWITAYGVDDMITSQINPANGKAQILMARQMEFIAELMAMATSPNQEVRDLIDPQYAQVLKKMFNSLGIEWG